MTRGLKPSTIIPGSSPVSAVPKTPSYLSKEAKAEWRKVAPILAVERNVLTEADLATLETYCLHYGLVRQAEREIAVNGLIDANGKRNPAYGIIKESSTLLARYAAELGLTPAARSRATISEAANVDEDFV